METLEFKNSAEFFTGAERIVKDKDPAYDRAPVASRHGPTATAMSSSRDGDRTAALCLQTSAT